MTTVLNFVNNSLNLFRYETFDFTISNPNPSLYSLQFGTVSSQLVPYLVNNGSNVVFSSTVFSASPSSNLVFVINALDSNGTIALASSNAVTIGNGRFRDSNGFSLTGGVLTLYKNEPFTPIQFNAPFTLSNPIITTPSLPAGISFTQVFPYRFDLSGLPTVQTPSSNYLFIGKNVDNPSQLVTTSNYTISVGPERVVLTLLGEPTVTMTEDQPISFRLVTAAYPPYATPGGTLQYSWPALPDGLYFSDLADVPKTSPFVPSDPESSIVLRGTPTSNAVLSFVNANISNYTITLNALRLLPPNISNSINFTFGFNESIVFDPPNLTPLYVDLSINSSTSSNSFKANTYFGPSSAVITNIFSPNLVSDLSLTFNAALSRAFLTGVPRSSNIPGGTYTIRAVSSTGVTSDVSANLVITNDSVSFVARPAIDACYNFIVGRPLTSLKTGYYTSNIVFSAVSAAGCNITFTTPELIGTGVTTSQANGTLTLGGTPTTVTPLTTLNVTATAADTLATATTTVKFAVVPDDFTFNTLSNLTFLQNFPISPVQITASTLSDLNISTFSSSNLPEGLFLSSTGLIQGTPAQNTNFLDSSFTVVASTGFSTDSQSYTYTTLPDAIAFAPVSNVALFQNQPIPPTDVDPVTQIQAFSFSGNPVTNLQIVGLDASYGLTISSNGILGGFYEGGVYSNTPLLSNVTFQIQGTVGSFVGTQTFNLLTSSNPSVLRYILTTNEGYRTTSDPITSYYNVYGHYTAEDSLTRNPLAQNTIFTEEPADATIPYNIGYYDIQAQYPGLSSFGQVSNLVVFARNQAYPVVSTDGGLTVTDLSGATTNDARRIYQVAVDSSGTWFGTGMTISSAINQLYTSTDGLDWDTIAAQPIPAKGRWGTYGTSVDPTQGDYAGGSCLRYKSGVLMYGGGRDDSAGYTDTILRTTNNGVSWTPATGQFTRETNVFNLEGSVCLAGGSDAYEHENPSSVYVDDTNTLKYSTDLGQTWSNVSGGFTFACTDIQYGNGKWIASGISYSNSDYVQEFRYSLDGSNWSLIDLGVSYPGRPFIHYISPGYYYPYAKTLFDGFNWTLFIQRINPYFSNDSAGVTEYHLDTWLHVDNTLLGSNWSNVRIPAEDFLRYTFNQNVPIAGRQLGPMLTTTIFASGAQDSILSSQVGKAVFTDPRV